MQIAETIQTAHINRAPSAAHDINPSTAADTREPVVLEDRKVGADEEDDEDDDDIPTSVLRPRRRFSHLPPLPLVTCGSWPPAVLEAIPLGDTPSGDVKQPRQAKLLTWETA